MLKHRSILGAEVAGLHRRDLVCAGYRPMDEAAQPSFRFLQQLAIDISRREISFPTFIDATLRVRRALNNPKMDTSTSLKAA